MTEAVLAAPQANEQMGVSMLILGEPYWFPYLDTQVENSVIDSATRDEWEQKYDGYQMQWTFTNPVVPSGDNNIDAMCIQGNDPT